MRGVSRSESRVALLLAVLLVFGATVASADDPPTPTDPPQARLNPPVGATTQARLEPPVGGTPRARITPAVGVMPQARLNPPVGTPDQVSLFDTILLWFQARLSVSHR